MSLCSKLRLWWRLWAHLLLGQEQGGRNEGEESNGSSIIRTLRLDKVVCCGTVARSGVSAILGTLYFQSSAFCCFSFLKYY